MATLTVEPRIVQILANGRTDGDRYFLPPTQLDRPTYEAVNKVLTALGGKWNRGAKAHLFEYDAEEAIERVILTGCAENRRQKFQFFATPTVLAHELVIAASIGHGMSVLEPSAGKGAIVQAVLDLVNAPLITCIELDPVNAAYLREHYPTETVPVLDVFEQDFLSTQPYERFDRVVMNPPFTRQQDIAHVMHAYRWLKPGGRLVSVMGGNVLWREGRRYEEFRELVRSVSGTFREIPAGAFRESGTEISTCWVVLDKPVGGAA